MTEIIKNKDASGIAVSHGEDDLVVAHGETGTAIAHGEYALASAWGRYGLAEAHGKYGMAQSRGEYGLVKGMQTGCQLTLRDHTARKNLTVTVGEDGIKADTYYGMKDGKFTEMK